jgi:hypothetical protein
MDLVLILLLIITVLLIAIFLFVGDKLLGTKEGKLDGSYFLKALLTAVVIILLIIAAGAVIGFLSQFIPGIGPIVTILGFILATYAVKMLLMKHGVLDKAIWVTFIAYLLVYIVNGIAVQLGQQPIILFI